MSQHVACLTELFVIVAKLAALSALVEGDSITQQRGNLPRKPFGTNVLESMTVPMSSQTPPRFRVCCTTCTFQPSCPSIHALALPVSPKSI
jgi:hypothetical protein